MPLRRKVHCMAAASSAADGRHTRCSAAVVSPVDGRQTVSFMAEWQKYYAAMVREDADKAADIRA